MNKFIDRLRIIRNNVSVFWVLTKMNKLKFFPIYLFLFSKEMEFAFKPDSGDYCIVINYSIKKGIDESKNVFVDELYVKKR